MTFYHYIKLTSDGKKNIRDKLKTISSAEPMQCTSCKSEKNIYLNLTVHSHIS